MKKVKLQIIFSGLCFVLSLMMLLGTSFAYFSDTKQVTNTMTAGNVSIELTEAAVKDDGTGNLIEDPAAPRIKGGVDATVRDYGSIYPGISIYKDPTVKNVGDTDTWIAAVITVSDGAGELYKVIGYDGFAGIDLRALLSGGVLDEGSHFGQWNGIDNVRYNDRYAMVQKADVGMGEYRFLIFFHNTFAPGEEVELFDTFSIPSQWTNAQMQELSELKIHIQAYGVQVFDLESCYEAMTAAFPTHFVN